MNRKKKHVSATRRLHRSLGAGAAAFIIFMVFSGFAINHSQELGLDKRPVTQPFLLDWYGLGEPVQVRHFAAGDHWISFADSQLYLDGTFISSMTGGVGAVFAEGILTVAGESELILLGQQGELIERIPWDQVDNEKIRSVGTLGAGRVAVRSAENTWLADEQLLQWQSGEPGNVVVQWSEPTPAPEEIGRAVSQHYRSGGLSLERLFLDIHSGRFFGAAGVLLYDLLAMVVGFLALSGLYFWARGRRNGKKNNGY